MDTKLCRSLVKIKLGWLRCCPVGLLLLLQMRSAAGRLLLFLGWDVQASKFTKIVFLHPSAKDTADKIIASLELKALPELTKRST